MFLILSINPNGSLKPVMAWIHGGGFNSGSGNKQGPNYMLDRDIVLVTINYRLGALGKGYYKTTFHTKTTCTVKHRCILLCSVNLPCCMKGFFTTDDSEAPGIMVYLIK